MKKKHFSINISKKLQICPQILKTMQTFPQTNDQTGQRKLNKISSADSSLLLSSSLSLSLSLSDWPAKVEQDLIRGFSSLDDQKSRRQQIITFHPVLTSGDHHNHHHRDHDDHHHDHNDDHDDLKSVSP